MQPNHQKQHFSITQEEPILGYLFKKLLRQDPNMKFANLNNEVRNIEKQAEKILDREDPEIETRIENMLSQYDEEEIMEMLIDFFEDLTDEPLTESQQIAKSNDFLEKFGFQIVKNANGTTNINYI
ncbi:MAG TPA: hypothetical protein VI861_04200 [Rickettsiales bacterium]|nr:hypothetical protein [Rickettsiales bacterium]